MLKTLIQYLKSPLVRTNAKSSTDEQTVKALNFMASSLLLIGLATSWLAILPFVYTVVAMFAHPIIAWIVGAFVCLTISLLCDKPLGIFVPQFCDKLIAIIRGSQSGAIAIFKLAALLSLSIALGLLTMNLSSVGGTLTARMLFENQRPVQNGLAPVQNDSIKRAAVASIQAANVKELSEAIAKDKQQIKEAEKQLEKDQYLAHKKYPNAKTNKWEHDQLEKALADLTQQHKNRLSSAQYAEIVRNKINGQIYETSQSFEAQKEINEKNYKQAMADYERKVSVANVLLRDLGYWSTPLFFVVVFISVLMGLSENSEVKKKHKLDVDKDGIVIEEVEVEDADKKKVDLWGDAMKHITTYLDRLNDAVSVNNLETAKTNARAILIAYSTAEQLDSERLNAWFKRKRMENKYKVFEVVEVAKFA